MKKMHLAIESSRLYYLMRIIVKTIDCNAGLGSWADLSRCAREESPEVEAQKIVSGHTESENRLSDDQGEDGGRAETRWPMTKREERSRDRCATVDQSCSLGLGESPK